MKTQTAKQKRNGEILEVLKPMNYTKKEKLYAPLIIEILEAANEFGTELENCVVDHTIIEQNLYNQGILSFTSDEFGRSESEMGKRFVTACKKLNQVFNKNNPTAMDFTDDMTVSLPYRYFTKEYTQERNFMRGLILKIVAPLKLKRVKQPVFVTTGFYNKKDKLELTLTFTSGTRGGNYICGEDYTLARSASAKELKVIQQTIEAWMSKNDNELPSVGKVSKIIKSTLVKNIMA